jgi:hypothetical protein
MTMEVVIVRTVPRGDPFDDDRVEGALELDVDELLERGPVTVDELANAGLDVGANERGHVASLRRRAGDHERRRSPVGSAVVRQFDRRTADLTRTNTHGSAGNEISR